jgi:hypothetical protein
MVEFSLPWGREKTTLWAYPRLRQESRQSKFLRPLIIRPLIEPHGLRGGTEPMVGIHLSIGKTQNRILE